VPVVELKLEARQTLSSSITAAIRSKSTTSVSFGRTGSSCPLGCHLPESVARLDNGEAPVSGSFSEWAGQESNLRPWD
jgi:hypothetical protein